MSTSVQSNACCSTPAVVSSGYKAKGTKTTVEGTTVYSTGAAGAKKGILYIYDIFGLGFDQTLQGADILATGDNENPYQVFVPDFFDGEAADISWYPPDNEDKKAKLGEFFQTKAPPPKNVPRALSIVKALQAANPSITSWGVVGFCWGGKITNVLAKGDSFFKSAAAAHPAMVDANDAPEITIPIMLLPSSGEDKKDVEAYEKGLKVKHVISNDYWDQIHGFMAARANLSNPDELKAYEKGYRDVLNWFHETL